MPRKPGASKSGTAPWALSTWVAGLKPLTPALRSDISRARDLNLGPFGQCGKWRLGSSTSPMEGEDNQRDPGRVSATGPLSGREFRR